MRCNSLDEQTILLSLSGNRALHLLNQQKWQIKEGENEFYYGEY